MSTYPAYIVSPEVSDEGSNADKPFVTNKSVALTCAALFVGTGGELSV